MLKKWGSLAFGIVLLFASFLPYASALETERDGIDAWEEFVATYEAKGEHQLQDGGNSDFEEVIQQLQQAVAGAEKSQRLTALTKGSGHSRLTYQKQSERSIQGKSSIDLERVNERRILVKVKEGMNFAIGKYQVTSLQVTDQLRGLNFSLVQVPETEDYVKILTAIQGDLAVETAEPDYLREISYIPVDSYYNEQWYLNAINLERGWDVSRGSSDVIVAVLDSGVNPNHPDLYGRVLPGYDFVNGDSDAMDDNGHGTHVAGLIAANSDASGIAGVDHRAKILPVKISNRYGSGSTYDAVSGIYYAIENGADVINMSYGGYDGSPLEFDALMAAYQHGIVLVAAAGNDGTTDLNFPSAYPGVISVAASDQDDRKASFSNYGAVIDITAPGVDILSTNHLGNYGVNSGTSFSAPLVSGIAALLKAKHPSWSPAQIEGALEAGARNVNGSEWDRYGGFGKVNAYDALTAGLAHAGNDVSNSRSSATHLESGQVMAEQIDLPMDLDWFHFNVEQDATVTVKLTNGSAHLDLVSFISKYDGNTELLSDVIDETFMGEDEQFTFNASPGDYYLEVFDYYDHWSLADYQVEVTIDTSVDRGDETELVFEVEPNDSFQTADRLPYGSMGVGFFQTYYDLDFYKMDLPYSGDVVVATVIDRYAYGTTPIALLVNEAGDTYGNPEIFLEDDGEFKYVFEVFENVKTGPHYLVAGNAEDYPENYYPYFLFVSYLGDVNGEVGVPQASVESGTYYEAIDVTLSAESGAEIKYTTNGEEPGISNGHVYHSPLHITTNTTLKAVAIKDGVESNVVTWHYTIEQISVDPPQATPAPGTYHSAVEVSLTNSDTAAQIYYTRDGSTPTLANGTLYEHPLVIEKDTTIKAIAVKDRTISEVAAFSYLIRSEDQPAFTDISGNWAEDDILYLVERKLINGYPDGTFRPHGQITRAEAATMIVREQGLSLKEGTYTDVRGHWASKYIGAAAEAGIFTGYKDGTFHPNGLLTREEMAAVLVRAYNLEGSTAVHFSDVGQTWSYPYIEKLVANNISNGYPDGTFRPKNKITRAEFAVMMARVLR